MHSNVKHRYTSITSNQECAAIGYRGIDPRGLTELATLLEHRCGDIDTRARKSVAILHSLPHPAADAFAASVQSVVAWASAESENLRWRADAIQAGQNLDYGRGVRDLPINEVRAKELIATFLPSRLGLDKAYRAWVAAEAAAVGRGLGERYVAGEDVSLDLHSLRYRASYESIAAAFFNTIGAESTAYLPQNVDVTVWQGTMTAEDAASSLQRYAHAFAAATRSGDLGFTVEELFTRHDPLADINEKYAGALLFTEPRIAPAWLEAAAQLVVVSSTYIPWIIAPQVVAAIVRGLASNPDVAARQLRQPQAVDYLLRRSSLVGEEMAVEIGELLVVAATSQDSESAVEVAGAMIAAIGSGDVHPPDAVLPYAAIVGGVYIDELAYSLADSVADPTYSPRFEVSRATAQVFVREVMRNTEGYATLMAATQLWMRSIIAPAGAATFDEYTSWAQNKTDDIGRLLGTIISADEVIAVEEAEERTKRRAILLDVVKALGQVGAEFTGPASVALRPSVEVLRSRAKQLLGSDHLRDAYHANQLLQEAILDELDEALHQVISAMNLTDDSGELDPREIELKEGAVRNLLRGLIAAELLASSVTEIRPDPG